MREYIVIPLRKLLRRMGFLPLIRRLTAAQGKLRKSKLESIYERDKPETTTILIGGYNVSYKLSNSEDYCRLQGHHEKKFASALLSCVRPGDSVWDIGANMGLYTIPLAKAVTNSGSVHAFEPIPTCLERLKLNIHLNGLSNVYLHQIALSDKCSNGKMMLSSDPRGSTSYLVNNVGNGYEETIDVEVFSGDAVRIETNLQVPAIIKIDVEGAEEDVLTGLKQTLLNLGCRNVFCEVHHSMLESKGIGNAAAKIKHFLKDCGFNKVKWIDSSHLAASRY
jgi:FkbM family methyltransferase